MMSKLLIKIGDQFQLGDHTLLCGDATNKNHVESLIKNQKIKMILTDVPYGVDVVESKKNFMKTTMRHKHIANDHFQSDEAFFQFTTQWIDLVKEKLEEKNCFYIFNSDKMMFPMRDALVNSGFKFSQILVWVKTGAVIGRLDYLPQHELLGYGWYGKHEFLKSKDKSVLVSPKTKKNDVHPTIKPISVLRRLILNSSRTGDTIYDPFGGSGSTLLACEQTKRKCLMVELEKEYCRVIIDRWEKLTGLKVKKIS